MRAAVLALYNNKLNGPLHLTRKFAIAEAFALYSAEHDDRLIFPNDVILAELQAGVIGVVFAFDRARLGKFYDIDKACPSEAAEVIEEEITSLDSVLRGIYFHRDTAVGFVGGILDQKFQRKASQVLLEPTRFSIHRVSALPGVKVPSKFGPFYRVWDTDTKRFKPGGADSPEHAEIILEEEMMNADI